MITIKIDVTRIDKNRLFKGEKGTYLDAVLIETPNSEYADYMIKQSVSKEEREQGIEGNILGNAKKWETIPPKDPQGNYEPDDDLSF